jgi:hypothetical protein
VVLLGVQRSKVLDVGYIPPYYTFRVGRLFPEEARETWLTTFALDEFLQGDVTEFYMQQLRSGE